MFLAYAVPYIGNLTSAASLPSFQDTVHEEKKLNVSLFQNVQFMIYWKHKLYIISQLLERKDELYTEFYKIWCWKWYEKDMIENF